jgi:hypothetical protein
MQLSQHWRRSPETNLRKMRKKGDGPAFPSGAVGSAGQSNGGAAGGRDARRRFRLPAERRGPNCRPDRRDSLRQILMFIPEPGDRRARPGVGMKVAGVEPGAKRPEEDDDRQPGACRS